MPPATPSSVLSGRVLIAEAEAIVALDLEDSLRARGFEIVGPFSSCAEAEGWVKRDGFVDAAILGGTLRDGPCDTLARDLSKAGVPVIIFTGESSARISERGIKALIVPKPSPIEALVEALQAAFDGSSGPRSRSYSASAIP